MTARRSRGPLWLLLGLVLAAWLVYLGVSATAPDHDPSAEHALASDLVFAPWDSVTWSKAVVQPALVFLLVSDSTSKRALDLEAWLRNDSIRTTVAARFLPIRIDRRTRPDLAERYAENQVPHLSVLLPSGEALSRLSGEPETWTEQLVETARYWHDHQSELRDRAEDFWQHQAEDTVELPPSTPEESHLATVDSAVFALVSELLEAKTPSIWRTDLDRYLSARNHPAALSTHARLKQARELRRAELSQADAIEATRAEWFRTVLELRRYGGLDISAEHLRTMQTEWDQGGPAVTAEEAALAVQWAHASGLPVPPSYPGTWLGLDSSVALSLPHVPGEDHLDGYFADAFAWLECLLDLNDPHLIPSASRLADSVWTNLWDPARKAFRDKPVRAAFLREVQVYPRAQLGRAATLFDRLARASGETRFRSRADSCLAGFSPYVQQAGAAATLYGEALLRRAGTS